MWQTLLYASPSREQVMRIVQLGERLRQGGSHLSHVGHLELSVCMLYIHGIEVQRPRIGRDALARQDHQTKLTEG
jgi:hypothetical protein